MEKLKPMKESIEDALDQINSSRSSPETRTAALQSIERCLAQSLADKRGLEPFLALQYTFECNVPLRLLSWLALATTQLDIVVKGRLDEHLERQVDTLASQIVLSLSLIQGIALSHPTCKAYLARRYPQEVILDLLLASRHLPLSQSSSPDASERRKGETPLSSIVLDTLLCVLVDSSSALRTFEVVGGPQVVVRILKRATTPREVRMKCLEFLYFYLLDETIPTSEGKEKIRADLEQVSPQKPVPVPRRPSTPLRVPSSNKPRLSATPLRPPSSSYGSSAGSIFSPSPCSSRSASNSSAVSFSSTSSTSTAASSLASSPEKSTQLLSRSDPRTPRSPEKKSTATPTTPKAYGPTKHAQVFTTPPSSPPPLDPARSKYRFPQTPAAKSAITQTPKAQSKIQPKVRTNLSPKAAVHPGSTTGAAQQAAVRPRSTMMLKKEVDYEPTSPIKPPSGAAASTSAGSSSGSGSTPAGRSGGPSAMKSPSGHAKSKSTSVLGGTLSRERDARRDIRESLGKEGGRSYVKPRLYSAETVRDVGRMSLLEEQPSSNGGAGEKEKERERDKKTTEEKKQLLGTMLGNVDALVEGVRKAGIWGLA